MLPFVNFFGTDYPSYVLMGLAGFFVAVIVASFRAKRFGFYRGDTVFIGAFAGFGLLLGGASLFAVTRIPAALEHRDITMIFGGLVFYGGLFGAVGGILLYAKAFKASVAAIMSLFIPVIPLAHAIMRVGCFMGGCCHGIEHPRGIAFTNALGSPNGVPLIPVQLFEAAVNLAIFIFLWVYSKKERHWLDLACLYGLLYGFARFWLEFLRGDEARGFLLGLSTSQIISVALIFACLLKIAKKKS